MKKTTKAKKKICYNRITTQNEANVEAYQTKCKEIRNKNIRAHMHSVRQVNLCETDPGSRLYKSNCSYAVFVYEIFVQIMQQSSTFVQRNAVKQ